jgi:putative ABC transport system permease protein
LIIGQILLSSGLIINLLLMFSHYARTALLNLRRNRPISVINLFGLTVGIAACLVICIFILNELSYDRYNKKADRIVRVIFKGTVQGRKMNEANVMPPTAQTLAADYPEVQEATRLRDFGVLPVTYGDNTFKTDAVVYADSNFFHVFTIPFLQGDPNTALLRPNTIVISRNVAHKYFGDVDPIGKTLTCKEWSAPYTITGVFDKVPDKSHFHFDLFASMASLADSRSTSWMSSLYYTYLVLPAGYNYKQLEAKLPQVVEKYMKPQVEKALGMSMAQFRQKGNNIGLFLQPLTDIHLYSDSTSDMEPPGSIHYIYIFGAIALFMLLMASINFMNLFTKGAPGQAREAEIRKALDSLKWGRGRQFLVESALLVLIAFLIASPLAWLITSKWVQDFAYHIDISWWIFILSVLLTVAITLITVSFRSIKATLTAPLKSPKSK